MKVLLLAIVAVLAILVAIALVARSRSRADARRRQEARAAYETRKSAEEAERVTEELAHSFPFVRTELQARLKSGAHPLAALTAALDTVPGVRLGSAVVTLGAREYFVPAVWPETERRKHGYLVGRTGSGKTTAMTIAIKADIDAGHGLLVMAPDHEFFAEVLLPLCERRANEVVYIAPGDPRCTICLAPLAIEPGDDPARCAGEVFEILRRAIGQDGFGTRTGPILANCLPILAQKPGSTIRDVRRFIEDTRYREDLLAGVTDDYLLNFWRVIYAAYPRGSHLPLVNRLDELLRSPVLRRTLCNGRGLSIRQAINQGRVILIDLGRLDPQAMSIVGQFVLAMVQLELLRRETEPTAERRTFYLYADEAQTFAAFAETSIRELMSRGRRYGCAVTLANQFPSQLVIAVRDEILSNAAALLAFSLGAKDSDAVRKELLHYTEKDGLQPAPLAALVNQPVGSAVAKLGSGACAVRLRIAPPVDVPGRDVGDRVRATSWATFGNTEPPERTEPTVAPRRTTATGDSPALSDAESRFLKAVVANPGQPSAQYAKALGLNGSKAARIRKALVARGLVREHPLARKAQGKPALILEPMEPAAPATETSR